MTVSFSGSARLGLFLVAGLNRSRYEEGKVNGFHLTDLVGEISIPNFSPFRVLRAFASNHVRYESIYPD